MHHHNYYIIHLVIFLLICGSSCSDDNPMQSEPNAPNILLIIADDLGKDAISGYTEGIIKPMTPHIDAIRNAGLTFNNFWSYPTCTPTRASILTGKYGYRTGIKWAGDQLSSSEKSIQQFINENTDDLYETAIIGKWHLSGSDQSINPESFGIDYYTGLIRGSVNDYYNWQETEDASSGLSTEYTTTSFTDSSIEWLNERSEPWFLWLAYNAPHTPFHVPPSEMHQQGDLPEYQEGLDPMPYYVAAIEAMDFQIGRLLDSMSPEVRENTVIIFIGDNGSPNDVAQFPYSSTGAKGTLYQGGINVPMFISGHGVTRLGSDDNLVSSTDLFATIAKIAGVDITEIHNSKSFNSLLSENTTIRSFQYAELDNGNKDEWAIRNDRFKLIVNANGQEEMYDLQEDAYESNNLLNGSLNTVQTAAKSALETELLEIRN